MEEKEAESADPERLYQGVSSDNEPCNYPATMHCATCSRWFCDVHAGDEEWHPCTLPLEKRAARHSAQFIDPALGSANFGGKFDYTVQDILGPACPK